MLSGSFGPKAITVMYLSIKKLVCKSNHTYKLPGLGSTVLKFLSMFRTAEPHVKISPGATPGLILIQLIKFVLCLSGLHLLVLWTTTLLAELLVRNKNNFITPSLS